MDILILRVIYILTKTREQLKKRIIIGQGCTQTVLILGNKIIYKTQELRRIE